MPSSVYINPEHKLADRWNEIFALVREQDFDSFRTAVEKLIAEEGTTVDVEIFGYQSLIGHAAAHSLEVLRYLVEEKNGSVDLKSTGFKDQTPLFLARGPCVSFLLRQGCDVLTCNAAAHTAFTAAIHRGDYDQARDFLRAGMDPFQRDGSGDSPVYLAAGLQLAIENDSSHEAFWDSFFDSYARRSAAAGSTNSPNSDDPSSSSSSPVSTLLNVRYDGGNTCLHAAASRGKGALVR
eukprot:GHVU01008844.1.p1 GENE.GHVU01008844.1~~GHVU01008844.1.p1  ORF type:complete len:237 (+),score=41.97 GHVU01008844.1:386-1096(+)